MCAMRNIHVVAYDPNWPEAYEREATRLASIFGDELVSIHHIGSTSVVGLAAKPIIDIMPLVHNVARVDDYNPAMIEAGYQAWGEYGIPGRRYFSKGGDEWRTHHVHVFEAGSYGARRHLDFRDYLRAHPEEAQAYAALKISLARQFPHDIYAYMDGKDAFVKAMEQKAGAWAHQVQSGSDGA